MTGSQRSSTRHEPGKLEKLLGHRFRDPALLQRALTHASSDSIVSNERLEFLGDRVLGLVIAEKLHKLYPADSEGALALKFNALVRKEPCAKAAMEAGLSSHLILANSEVASGGRNKSVILAGACEAVIAALYLDGGMKAARSFIERYWAGVVATLNDDLRDAKTALQEWTQAQQVRTTPLYRLVERQGPDHAPKFIVEVSAGREARATGEGGSKREAEQAAAASLLEKVRHGG
jgi:ribonuclease-3